MCGPSNDWDRIFDIYDLTTAGLIKSSNPYTYQGIPMRKVPGTDDFIAVTSDMSPTDFYLYRVESDGAVTTMRDSPYHGDFPITTAYAFDSTPAEHVITATGLMLKIYADGCVPGCWGKCFIKDGELGTLASDEHFSVLADDGAGAVYALAAKGYWYETDCTDGCRIQRIDVKNRRIMRELSFKTENKVDLVAAVFNPWNHRFLVGFMLEGRSDGTYSGYQVRSFDLE